MSLADRHPSAPLNRLRSAARPRRQVAVRPARRRSSSSPSRPSRRRCVQMGTPFALRTLMEKPHNPNPPLTYPREGSSYAPPPGPPPALQPGYPQQQHQHGYGQPGQPQQQQYGGGGGYAGGGGYGQPPPQQQYGAPPQQQQHGAPSGAGSVTFENIMRLLQFTVQDQVRSFHFIPSRRLASTLGRGTADFDFTLAQSPKLTLSTRPLCRNSKPSTRRRSRSSRSRTASSSRA